jgi:NTP pyrophosphatase (non-canonical NTP hydrolase)
MTDINIIAEAVHLNARDHGFWDVSTDIPTKLMLIVTEVAEAMEAYRKTPGGQLGEWDYRDKPVGFPVELVDIIIRCLDLAVFLGIDVEDVIQAKHAYNVTRPRLHGKRV